MWWAKANTPADEVLDWEAWFQMRDQHESWLHTGRICEVIAKSVGNKDSSPSQFVPKPTRELTEDETEQRLAAFLGPVQWQS